MMWIAFAAAVSGPAVIPAEFRGEWNSRLSACGTADWDPLSIDAKHLVYEEYAGNVNRVVRHSRRIITVFATYSAEGHPLGDGAGQFALSASGNELTVRDARSASTRYYRCAANRTPKNSA
jgi:hypothetical protein